MTTFKKYFDIKLLVIAIFSSIITSLVIINVVTPCKLYPAGYSGISRIASDLSSDHLPFTINYSFTYFLLNIVTCVICFKYIGKKFAIYSAIQFTFVSILTFFMKPIGLPLDFENDLLLIVIFGGIISGTSNGLCLRFGFSTGGTDFIGIYVSHKNNHSFWNYIFGINVCILCLAGLLYGIDKTMYSIVFQFFHTTIIKLMHNRYTYKTLSIVTKMPNEVANGIVKHVRHGITELKTEGFFSKEESTMLYTVINSFQYREVLKIVKEIDPHAFINVQDTREIHGNYYQKPLD